MMRYLRRVAEPLADESVTFSIGPKIPRLGYLLRLRLQPAAGTEGRRRGGWRARVNHGGFKWILQTPSRRVYPRRCIVLVESLRHRATPQRGYNRAKRFRAGENARPGRRPLAVRARQHPLRLTAAAYNGTWSTRAKHGRRAANYSPRA